MPRREKRGKSEEVTEEGEEIDGRTRGKMEKEKRKGKEHGGGRGRKGLADKAI